jgi:hypothetical protein
MRNALRRILDGCFTRNAEPPAGPRGRNVSRAVVDSLEPRLMMTAAAKLGSVSGTIYNDVNGNGIRDVGEPGLKHWRVFADMNTNGIYDSNEPSALSGRSGDYTINGAFPVWFYVFEFAQPGWQVTAPPGGGRYTLQGDIFPGDHTYYTDINFGNQLLPPPATAAALPLADGMATTGSSPTFSAGDPITDSVLDAAPTLLSADPHSVTLPLHADASGNLQDNFVEGHATLLGHTTAAFISPDEIVFTAANGDQVFAAPVLTPISDTVVHVEGSYIGGTGRFTGATGTFSLDLIYVNDQGDFVYQFRDTITLQRPWNGKA